MTVNLDSPGEISAVDRYGMRDALEAFPKLCREALKIGLEADLSRLEGKNFSNVVFLGMGGSAIGGSLIRDWAYDRLKVPMEVCRDLLLPGYVDRETLIVAVSYSGNT
ncbi:MAG: bifunctional phosphoglucose/phosphomannose isomerase, partial [Candidatus Hecatellales archaeon]